MRQSISQELSNRMANMGFVCACLVVLIHCTVETSVGTFSWWWCQMFAREGICIIAVPYFFLASGFFLVGGMTTPDWWQCAVRKRLRSLVVPFVLWGVFYSVFGFCVWWAKTNVFHVYAHESTLNQFGFSTLAVLCGIHPFADIGVLWFIRCLFMLVLVSPLIVYAIKFRRLFFCVVVLLFGVFLWLNGNGFGGWNFYSLFDRFFSIRGLLYFSIGIALRLSSWRTGDRMVCVSGLVMGYGLLIIRSMMVIRGWSGCANVFEAVSVPLIMAGVFYLVPTRRWHQDLVGNAFPVFLIHNIFLSAVAMLWLLLKLPKTEGCAIIEMFVRLGLAVLLSLLTAKSIKKVAPGFSAIIFGGR